MSSFLPLAARVNPRARGRHHEEVASEPVVIFPAPESSSFAYHLLQLSFFMSVQ